MISKSFSTNSIFHRWGVQRITYRESMGGWYGCFVGFPVINMPRMMPCVSTIPPKPSDRTIGSTTAPLYISLFLFSSDVSLSTFLFRSDLLSPFMGIHRSHKKFDTFPVAWHGCVLDWASPRWCFPLPPSRNSRRGGTPSILAMIRIDGLTKIKGTTTGFLSFVYLLYPTTSTRLRLSLFVDHHEFLISKFSSLF